MANQVYAAALVLSALAVVSANAGVIKGVMSVTGAEMT